MEMKPQWSGISSEDKMNESERVQTNNKDEYHCLNVVL
jgi:hypothetical protein